MSKDHLVRVALAFVTVAALVVPSAGLMGCRDTDLLKKIVYHPYATTEDPNKTVVVNDPDASETVPSLSAFDLADDAPPADTVENIIVPTLDTGNVDDSARRSVFDINPRLPGAESTDPVRLVESTSDTALDTDVETAKKPRAAKSRSAGEADKETNEKKESEAKGKKSSGSKARSTSTDTASKGSDSGKAGKADAGGSGKKKKARTETGGKAKGGDGKGGDEKGAEGGSGTDGKGKGGTSDEGAVGDGDLGHGTTARESGGYDGEDITYDPGNKLEKPQKSERIAATGQAAVVVQAIGGKGALAAMDAYTYRGLNANGEDDVFVSSFEEVFADELENGFAKNALLWRRDGSRPGYLADSKGEDNAAALVKVVANGDGSGGTILYCGEHGDQADYFSSKQLKTFKKAGVQLVPIDLTNPQGILDAVTVTAEILSGSESISEDPEKNAKQFRDAFNSIVKAAADTHGGKLAADNAKGQRVESYEDCPVSNQEWYKIYGAVSGDFEEGAVHKGTDDYRVDTEEALLGGAGGPSASPLSFYMRASGVIPKGLGGVLWGLRDPQAGKDAFSSYSDTGVVAKQPTGPTESYLKLIGENLSEWQLDYTRWSYGLGSRQYPYLVVSATAERSASYVKEAVVKASENRYSPYYAKSQSTDWEKPEEGKRTNAPNVIGHDQDFQGNLFADNGQKMSDTVRENPCGLLGNWTQGNLESVLECVWLANLYSKVPENSFYEPVNDMSSFSVDIGGTPCDSLKKAVNEFYKTVYRYDASSDYGKIVTDEGEGLN